MVAAPVLLAGCGSGEELPLPPDAVIGPFGKNSTAEEVTEGLDLTLMGSFRFALRIFN